MHDCIIASLLLCGCLIAYRNQFYILLFYNHTQSQRQCFDVYVVQLEPVGLERGSTGSGLHELVVIETGLIIPSGDETLTLNVTTNTILSTNMHYEAILITTTDMVEAGDFQFCT